MPIDRDDEDKKRRERNEKILQSYRIRTPGNSSTQNRDRLLAELEARRQRGDTTSRPGSILTTTPDGRLVAARHLRLVPSSEGSTGGAEDTAVVPVTNESRGTSGTQQDADRDTGRASVEQLGEPDK